MVMYMVFFEIFQQKRMVKEIWQNIIIVISKCGRLGVHYRILSTFYMFAIFHNKK